MALTEGKFRIIHEKATIRIRWWYPIIPNTLSVVFIFHWCFHINYQLLYTIIFLVVVVVIIIIIVVLKSDLSLREITNYPLF